MGGWALNMEIISITFITKSAWRYCLLVFIMATILLSITAPRSLSMSSFSLALWSATSLGAFLATPAGISYRRTAEFENFMFRVTVSVSLSKLGFFISLIKTCTPGLHNAIKAASSLFFGIVVLSAISL